VIDELEFGVLIGFLSSGLKLSGFRLTSLETPLDVALGLAMKFSPVKFSDLSSEIINLSN
jgi:hypothetical protein